MEFLDTPGVVTQEMVEKFKLSSEVVSGEFSLHVSPSYSHLFTLGPEKSCGGADVLLVVHDVSNRCAFTLYSPYRNDLAIGM